MRNIDVRRIFDGVAVASTGTALSSAYKMEGYDGDVISIQVEVVGSAPDIKIEFLVSKSEKGTYISVDDTNGTDLSTVIASTNDLSLSASTPQIYEFDPPLGKYFKIQLTGVNSNGTNTTVYLDIIRKED